MADEWVVNASPLIALYAVSHEHLLAQLAVRFVVPESVIDELMGALDSDRAFDAGQAGALPIVSDPAPAAEVVRARLGPGETAVLSFAMENPGWTAIMDDRAARRCAHSLGIPVKGVIGIAIMAQQRGIIPSAKELLLAVKGAGLFLDDRLIAGSLQAAFGEEW